MLCFAGEGQPVYDEKGDQHADYEYPDIQRKEILTENPCVGIEQYRYRECSGQYTCGQGRTDTGLQALELSNHIQRIEKHGKKAQLHVLPGGFTDREEKSYNKIMTGPVIDEM